MYIHVPLNKQWPDDTFNDSPAPHAAIWRLFARILTQEYKTWFEIAGAWVRVRAWCTCSKSISHSEWQASICRVFFSRLVWYHPWAVEEAPVTFFLTISSEYYIRTTCSITFELFDRNALFCFSFFSFVVNGLTRLDSSTSMHASGNGVKQVNGIQKIGGGMSAICDPPKSFECACHAEMTINLLILSLLCDWMEWSEWSYFKIRMNQYQNQYQNESEPAVEINVSVDCKRYLWTCPFEFVSCKYKPPIFCIKFNWIVHVSVRVLRELARLRKPC